jgi:isopenicillin N synthase-like dioxygenase
MDQLHTLDLSHFHSGNEIQRSEFCQKLLASFRENGFVKLINHGLSAEYVTEGLEYVSVGPRETRHR